MLYQAYQAHVDLMAPLRSFARVSQDLLNQGRLFGDNIVLRSAAAGWEMLARAGISHDRPPFGLSETTIDGQKVPVTERVVDRTPFCDLLHFDKPGAAAQPRVLVVAPVSGHFATLLRGTVETLLPDHDVYITDWYNARSVSLAHGGFGFDDFVGHVIRFLQFLGKGSHVMAVCQPAVPVLVALALMAANQDSEQPATMTLMGGPIDTRRAPTKVNEFATTHPLDWFERNVIGTVPLRYAGAFRRVYPGFLQLAGFMSMHLDRHVGAHVEMFENLIKGDGASVEATRAFYDEYLSVMDMPAEFFLQTVERVFQEFLLPRGLMVVGGQNVEPGAIEETALLTVEGERDDICGLGQTSAAHDLVTGLSSQKRRQYVQPAVGHYGVFNGRRWSTEIYPVVRDFIRAHG